MTQNVTPNESRSTGRSFAGRVFGVPFRRETYANLVYLFARFPLGIAYFVVFVTALSLGVGLVPVLVGVPILAGTLALAGYVGTIEAALLAVRGTRVSYRPASPGEMSVWPYLKTVATNPRNYGLLAFALASFAVGTALFTALVPALVLSVTLVAAPLLYWVPGVDYLTFENPPEPLDLGPVTLDFGPAGEAAVNTLPEAVVASLVGIALGIVTLHAVNLVANLFSRLVTWLLGTDPDRPARPTRN